MTDNSSELPPSNGSRVNGARADDVTRAAAARAMEELELRGIDNLLAANTPLNILGWCKWWNSSQNRDADIGRLAARIFSGRPAPKPAPGALDEQRAYGESICRFLTEKMPDVCRPSAKVIEWHRRCYGEADAQAIAASPGPHHAAVAAVIRLHYRHGKGALSIRTHGAEIRAAVRRADEQAIADYKLIAEKRGQSSGEGQAG